ncbi:MAG: hypothetical protein IMW93_04295 [Thermoanaerobacteraceae bacterium]|uniref:Uncharacterized protein n=1 Tax=Desulfofundulus thermobenzoicus TaxID=29376 RepID=A0A6N7IS51_9FIRM|nr:hypothetical protein [Desulfofundulus thermobenzoicus]MBE3587769.1 hypothetical protein [Thermoanaerobacteraceae bacterium]MQL52339.1 hypothetical protein [Desulfofundulus thermobenzoicus]HHW42256.1 hypothetical protein [Desulfotomaculum sp.]
METTRPQRTIVVSIQGWELEVLEGPRRVNVDLMGEMLEFKGIWLTEPERGMVTVLCYPDKVFYLEITEEEVPVKRPGRRNKVTPLRPLEQLPPPEKDK